ncbi:MAG TPA: flagellar biosynthetic protein FliO, partial [Anaeromyxobacteraceae bacterium]|nr:flagellar biosynthetic protein FliO [Anaeromyxobacteraceae bacterium]
ARRRRAIPRHVHVLETTALGPRRSLVVARLGGELLVLGASEAGITLLATRPAPAADVETAAAPGPERRGLGALFGAGRSRAAAPAPVRAPAHGEAFDHLLAESAEDLELRRKLARGQAGSVR